MGDVFDAMKRSKREAAPLGGPTGGNAPVDSPPPAADVPVAPETGSLPLEHIAPAARTGADDAAPALPVGEVPANIIDAPASHVSGAPAHTAGDTHASPQPQTSPAATVASAVTKARTQAVAEHSPAGPFVKGDSKHNGYGAELVTHYDRGSVITEQYRAVRTQILARGRNRRLQTHVITSSAPEEGKTVTSLNLGITFSELTNQKILLLECDLRRPSFERLMSRQFHAGMLQLLRGEVKEIQQVIYPTTYGNLQFIPAGGREPGHSSELLSSPRMAQVLDRLKDQYDHIIIDTPPVVTVTDACVLGALCDSVFLVVRLNWTPAEMVDRAKRLLRAANCEVGGAILTHLGQEPTRYLYRYAYGYSYGYGYGYGTKDRDKGKTVVPKKP